MSMIPHSDRQLSKPRAAKQSMARECDVNHIVAQSIRLGAIPQARTTPPQFIDLAGIPDFHDAINRVTRAKQSFDLLPSKIRAACGHDLRGYVSLMTDKTRREEAIQLGLVKPSTPQKTGDKKAEEPLKPDNK